jgi:hypothetical protein
MREREREIKMREREREMNKIKSDHKRDRKYGGRELT